MLEEGRQLDEDRKAWQRQAAKSLDRRAGTISRADLDLFSFVETADEAIAILDAAPEDPC